MVEHDPRAVDYSSSWALHLQPDGALLVDRASLFYVRLSALATELLLQFSRASCFEQVVATRSVVDNESPEQARKLLLQILEPHPVTRQWLEDGVTGHLAVTGSEQTFLPIAAALQLTNGCNLTCPYCYASSGERRPRELGTDEWISVVRRLVARGLLSVTLTGGEPTMVPGFRKILAAASGLTTSVAVFTNGYSWSRQNIDLAASLGNVAIQVSLDGGARTHDRIRGRAASFDRALDVVRAFSERGVQVDIAMTATPENYGEVYDVAVAVDRAGARLLRVSDVRTLGRAEASDAPGFGLDEAARAAVDDQLRRVVAEDRALEVYPWSGCDSVDDLIRETGMEPEFLVPGYLSWYVLSDGTVTPCQLEEVSVLGDILIDPLEAIGDPQRLAGAAARVHGCSCLSRVVRPERAELPYAERVS